MRDVFVGDSNMQHPSTPLFTFDDSSEANLFQPVDDRVMGGASQSSLNFVGESCAEFCGVVRADFGGGFASVRASSMQINADGYNGILLRVTGDGKDL